MRGRLIHPFLAEIAQLDTRATAEGPPTPGYDPDFREPVLIADPGGGSHSARREHTAIRLRCQVEVNTYNQSQASPSGDIPSGKIVLVFHFRDLEGLGMVDATTGEPTLHKGDRLVALRRVNGDLVQTFPDPPGLFATGVEPQSFGLSSQCRNLLLVTFDTREQAVRSA